MNKLSFLFIHIQRYSTRVPRAVRIKKPTSTANPVKQFVDLRPVRANGGKGGDGCISFLHLWSNELAGPDGGDGGNGGHVVFQASPDVHDLSHLDSVLTAEDGVKGKNTDCDGRNADHLVLKVPIGTVIKNDGSVVVADLERDGMMFVAARGGAGGKGNHYFVTDTEQSPDMCEYGARGEDLQYTVEIRSMAHMGLIGFPNAGKSSLLRAISRARPKVAPYPFTTLKPHLGIVLYDDHEQIAVADLPGLIPDSHRNKGLGIQFLRHAERCAALMYIIDVSEAEPWRHLHILQTELSQYSELLAAKPQVIIANKIDLDESEVNLNSLKERAQLPVIPISAKYGTNIPRLLHEIRLLYDKDKLTLNEVVEEI